MGSTRRNQSGHADAKSLIITTMGRLYPEGSVVDGLSMDTIGRPEKTEAARQLLEPIVATIELNRPGVCRVWALDHGGRKPSPPVELPIERTADGCRFTLNGTEQKTIYYLVEFDH